MLLLGYDIGTSSIKATLMDSQTQEVVASAVSPSKELPISAPKPGWAEQEPSLWWDNVKAATAQLLSCSTVDAGAVAAVGITYQMHGLVAVDKAGAVLRPSIIWCDSRAVESGERCADAIGREKCLANLLNYPGNFTAMKLKWVMDNEPDVFKRIDKVMLPGDYIAMKMTRTCATTPGGLSEGIFWDFKANGLSRDIVDYLGISDDLLPDVVPTFAEQGVLTADAAGQLGLKPGVPITYRAGDQPNNAFSLNVLNPGEIAATAGTSGVVYGIADSANYDSQSRVNTFVHVNHTADKCRYGVLLCLNGTGILNSWVKHNVMDGGIDYDEINALAAGAPVGSDGLVILPYGNGAERTLGNADIGASVHGLNFNVHSRSHIARAAQEGIVFALNYGLEIMRGMGISVKTVRAGRANMFLSPLFANAFATVTGAVVQLHNTDGSQGAARAAGVGAGIYKDFAEAFAGLEMLDTIEPDAKLAEQYSAAYQKWYDILQKQLNG